MAEEDKFLVLGEDGIYDVMRTPEAYMWALGVDEMEANFILAIERGEVIGDTIAVPDGEPIVLIPEDVT